MNYNEMLSLFLSKRNNVSPDATRTISTLNLMVTANQDEALLYCVAENSLFRNGSIIDLWQLEVHCKSIWLFFVYSACSSIHSMNLIGSSALYYLSVRFTMLFTMLVAGTVHRSSSLSTCCLPPNRISRES